MLETTVTLLDPFGLHLVAVRLARLRKQNERRGIGGLQREEKIQSDERVDVPGKAEMQLSGIQQHPHAHRDGLPDDVLGRAEEPCGSFRQSPERVVAKGTTQLVVTPRQLPLGLVCMTNRHDGRQVLDNLACSFRRSTGPVFRNDP